MEKEQTLSQPTLWTTSRDDALYSGQIVDTLFQSDNHKTYINTLITAIVTKNPNISSRDIVDQISSKLTKTGLPDEKERRSQAMKKMSAGRSAYIRYDSYIQAFQQQLYSNILQQIKNYYITTQHHTHTIFKLLFFVENTRDKGRQQSQKTRQALQKNFKTKRQKLTIKEKAAIISLFITILLAISYGIWEEEKKPQHTLIENIIGVPTRQFRLYTNQLLTFYGISFA